jgi:predicted metalloprotease
MRWTPGGTSEDVEDRRGAGGGRGGMRLGIGGFILIAALSLIFRKNFFALLSTDSGSAPTAGAPASQDPKEQRQVQFVSFVLDDVQKTWDKILSSRYRHAKLVLFTNGIDSACGFAQTASGPFYCPDDKKVYLDIGFFDEMKGRLGAGGEFAQAYVVAHEVGHHVQNLLGLLGRAEEAQQRGDRRSASDISVRTELQADCLAGVWGHSTSERGILESGDVEAGLGAAAAVGDDRLQRMATGRVQPESFTHGSSGQRVKWFKRGLDQGTPNACDTFSVPSP